MADSLLESYEALLNYVCSDHELDHRDGFTDEDEADCMTCLWIKDAKDNFQRLKALINTVEGIYNDADDCLAGKMDMPVHKLLQAIRYAADRALALSKGKVNPTTPPQADSRPPV